MKPLRIGPLNRRSRRKEALPSGRGEVSLLTSAPTLRFMESASPSSLRRFSHDRSRSGFVLIMVLVVVMLASMVAASLLYLQRSEKTAAAAGISGEQAWATAMSGVYKAMYVAAQATPESLAWRDDPASFNNHLVLDDGVNQWYFSVYSAGEPNAPGIRFGLADESSKINVNHADSGILERLPGMTPALAQVLAGSVHSTNSVLPPDSDFPAESGSTNATPIPNGSLGSLEELLHFPGFTSALLYGEDANLNGNLDPNEDDGEAMSPPDNQDAQLDAGLRPLLTVHSYDLNLSNDGQPRLNLNAPETDLSGPDWPESVRIYLEAMRRQKQMLAHPADLLEASGKFKDEKGTETNLSSGITKAELPALLDRFTGTNSSRLEGLVNLNTASAPVLAALPGSDAALADAIVSARVGLSDDARRTPAWLFQEGLVNADLFKKMAPHLTTRSAQFHFHVVAYAVPAGTYRVIEAVIDTAAQPPAVLVLRDLTRLGLPVGLELLREPVRQDPGTAPAAKNIGNRKGTATQATLPSALRRSVNRSSGARPSGRFGVLMKSRRGSGLKPALRFMVPTGAQDERRLPSNTEAANG